MPSPLKYGRRVAAVVIAFVAIAARAASADTLTLAWDPSTDSEVSGYIVYVGTQSSVYTQTFDIGNSTTFSYPNAAPGQKYYFTVAAYEPGPVLGTKSMEISGISNSAPVLTNPGNQTTAVGQSVSLQLKASDPDGQPVSYAVAALPAGLMLTTSTGLISGAPTTAGTYTVTANASDGVLKTSVSFTWTVGGQTTTAPALVSPAGTIATSTPKFVWNAAKGAVSYLLVVNDSKTPEKIRTTISASSAGCATTAVCSLSPGVALATGAAQWVVETLTSTGTGPWSAPLSFTVGDTAAPTIAIVSPAKAGTTYETVSPNITLSGTAFDSTSVTSVSWSNSGGGSGTAQGTTSWTASLQLKPGINVITVSARDGAANVSTASVTAILVVRPAPHSPTSVAGATPTFVWTAVPAASRYALKVTDSTLTVKALVSVTPFQAGCETTSLCSFKPATLLAPGTARWTVEAIAMTDIGAWSTDQPFTVDKTAPSITVAAPTRSSSYSTTTSTVSVSGVASDNINVSRVAWVDNRGRSGVATGTSQWSIGSLALVSGTTTFTITAFDPADNKASTTLTVNYTPPQY
jgi:hypothetical protein